jgi:hypothetical protein
MYHLARDVKLLLIPGWHSIIATSITTNEQIKTGNAPIKHPCTLAPAYPPPSRRARPAVACPAPAPAPSRHLLPSMPERTRLLLDLPPTCIPDPDPRHHNPVVGSRARVESGAGCEREREDTSPSRSISHLAVAAGGPVAGVRTLGALAPRSPCSSYSAHPRGTKRHVRARCGDTALSSRASAGQWARTAQRIAVGLYKAISAKGRVEEVELALTLPRSRPPPLS